MDLWSPPHDAPHLFEWWRPLVQASRRARAERLAWPIHVDEFRLAGRVSRSGRPDIWIYEHHANNGSLCVDASGDSYRFVATPGGSSPGQFHRCPLRTAVWKAGLHEVVARVSYGRTPDAVAPPEPESPAAPSKVVRRGHLTLVASA
jgi:hypothetical protein